MKNLNIKEEGSYEEHLSLYAKNHKENAMDRFNKKLIAGHKKLLKKTKSKIKETFLEDDFNKTTFKYRLIIVLLVLALIMALAFAFKKEDSTIPQAQAAETVEIKEEVVVKEVDITKKKEKIVYVDKTDFYAIENIYTFAKTYRGSKMTAEYFGYIRNSCKDNPVAISKVIALYVAETGLGRDTSNKSNFAGWFAGGNRSFDPSQKEMAQIMCKAVTGVYKNLPSTESVSMYVYGKSYSKLNAAQKKGVAGEQYRMNWALQEMQGK